jgi:DNA-binding HxlR family transcriptional regulator
MLTKQLRELEADGILSRKVYPEVPPRVEYTVTTYGESFFPVVDSMRKWGQKQMGQYKVV